MFWQTASTVHLCQYTRLRVCRDTQGHSSYTTCTHTHTYIDIQSAVIASEAVNIQVQAAGRRHSDWAIEISYSIQYTIPVGLCARACARVCVHVWMCVCNPHSPHSSWRWLRESLSLVYTNQLTQRVSVSQWILCHFSLHLSCHFSWIPQALLPHYIEVLFSAAFHTQFDMFILRAKTI